jgi:hypothetical protein
MLLFPICKQILLRNTVKNLKYWTGHLNNTPGHNSKRSQEAFETSGTTRVSHLAYGPDVVPSGFISLAI